ncbi:hypothetical protein KBZ21_41045 [Streptomyces sp. A73]|nr:hypothetical protein [Streptomyces sp. A73]
MSLPHTFEVNGEAIRTKRMAAGIEMKDLAEQQHLLDPVDLAFALLAVQHPDRCHTAADYDGWTPGGAA